ncbi:MAG TPA: HigA family addiction module antitoxin [Opitutaceae bacterium]|jgi:antitoxin HigA-1|nr:HigA family addiction module antidote protein [Opitutaceae bacterium]OQB93280.1 MAG: Antitoxin HigA-1 [Verrucomicrobia bacterium ADurb.Bin122]MBP8961864.1 HigA family addiction module antidote protein [Opitutaceae bacterium]HNW40497.1 HigA family addiction module antitoxin [Opitutaceae bacterium]HOD46085.1 HigA family addiction module antitoxin [Opitutaceae bacterium]
MKTLKPIHPGQFIKEDWLADQGLTQNSLARALKIPVSRLNDIIQGRRGISADTAVRLGRFFGNSPAFWLHLQADYDLRMIDEKRITEEIVPHVHAA